MNLPIRPEIATIVTKAPRRGILMWEDTIPTTVPRVRDNAISRFPRSPKKE